MKRIANTKPLRIVNRRTIPAKPLTPRKDRFRASNEKSTETGTKHNVFSRIGPVLETTDSRLQNIPRLPELLIQHYRLVALNHLTPEIASAIEKHKTQGDGSFLVPKIELFNPCHTGAEKEVKKIIREKVLRPGEEMNLEELNSDIDVETSRARLIIAEKSQEKGFRPWEIADGIVTDSSEVISTVEAHLKFLTLMQTVRSFSIFTTPYFADLEIFDIKVSRAMAIVFGIEGGWGVVCPYVEHIGPRYFVRVIRDSIFDTNNTIMKAFYALDQIRDSVEDKLPESAFS